MLLHIGLAQMVPYGLGLESGVHVLAFVSADCKACEVLRQELEGLPVTYIGSEPELDYEPYLQDTSHRLVARTLRVETTPTVLVLKDGQIAEGYTEPIATSEVRMMVEDVANGTRLLDYAYNIAIGERVEGVFANYTGLLVFYRESCEACLRGRDVLAEVCRDTALNITVLVTRGEEPLFEGCPSQHEHARDTAIAWQLPGVPSMVYLKEGLVTWVDLGYREDFREVAEALVATEGEVKR
ncbi:hypothetical protein [Truepera radiovictrix]|nr:hypothetical protein [Truepera radiovictrix]WMT57241.1 hypothetical protein RCV51_14630 [Truepera radiovictrix]